ncbi:phospholipase A1 member A-like isoform X2 [Chironomus tepperi]
MQNLTQVLHENKFSFKRPTTFIVTGWMMSPDAETTLLLTDGYIKYQNCNLIALDWSEYSVGLYTPVMYRMIRIARSVGRHLVKLFKEGLSDKTFHCVGHSFGAHACGIMGREIQQYSNNKFKFARITGLDPAGPNFFPPISEEPLGTKDATYVDTIHSDTFFIGTKNAIGHVSFFPNYKMVQPGCPAFSLISFYDYCNDMCSHFHAIRYYAETLNPKNCKVFPARQCTDWKTYDAHKCDEKPVNYMGIDSNPNVTGTFYVKITSKRYFDGNEFYNWLLDRIGDRVGNVFTFGLI